MSDGGGENTVVDVMDNSTFSLMNETIVSTTSPGVAGTLTIVGRDLRFDPQWRVQGMGRVRDGERQTMVDVGGLTSTATLTITVDGLLNHAPVAADVADLYLSVNPAGSATVNLYEYLRVDA